MDYKDIAGAMATNVNARINHNIIGPFMLSWLLVNWDKVALLCFGEGEINARIEFFKNSPPLLSSIQFGDSYLPILPWPWLLDFFLLPILMVAFFLFVMPLLSKWVEHLQFEVQKARHDQSIQHEIQKARKEQELYRAQTEVEAAVEIRKKELEREEEQKQVELELDLKHQKAMADREAEDASNAKALALQKENDAIEEQRRIEVESAEHEATLKEHSLKKAQSEESAALAYRHQATMNHQAALLTFTAFHPLLKELSKQFSFEWCDFNYDELTDLLSIVMGYRSFEDMLSDPTGKAKNLMDIQYFYINEKLVGKLSTYLKSRGRNEDPREVLELFLASFRAVFKVPCLAPADLVDDIKKRVESENCNVDEAVIAKAISMFDLNALDSLQLDLDEFSEQDSNEIVMEFTGVIPIKGFTMENNKIVVKVVGACPVLFGNCCLGEFAYDTSINAPNNFVV